VVEVPAGDRLVDGALDAGRLRAHCRTARPGPVAPGVITDVGAHASRVADIVSGVEARSGAVWSGAVWSRMSRSTSPPGQPGQPGQPRQPLSPPSAPSLLPPSHLSTLSALQQLSGRLPALSFYMSGATNTPSPPTPPLHNDPLSTQPLLHSTLSSTFHPHSRK